MFTRKSDRRFLSTAHWYAVALVLSCTTAASAQFGGMGGQPAEQRVFPNGLPKMEVMLKAALEHHPDVLAARSKLRAAEAEQRQAEFKALKDILDVRDRWEKANHNVVAGVPAADPATVRERLAAVAAVEWELAFLLGTRGELGLAQKPDGESGATAPQTVAVPLPAPVMVESAIPRGEKAKAIKKQLGEQITLSGDEVPLAELVKLLSRKSGLRFLLDKQALEDEGYPADSPIEIELGELELGAALEILEDLHKSLHFVVRDYGILVTTHSEQSSKNVSANDFWKLTEEELRDKLRHQREEELNAPSGMMGGMMGGGMGGGGVF